MLHLVVRAAVVAGVHERGEQVDGDDENDDGPHGASVFLMHKISDLRYVDRVYQSKAKGEGGRRPPLIDVAVVV